MQIFTIRDAKAETYNVPFTALTGALAMRSIQAGLNEQNQMAEFAEDFSLWNIGWFDIATGQIEACTPKHVVEVQDLIRRNDGEQSKR